MNTKGYINSIQTLGTLDGPGVRFTVFMQGCNLRCACCHNPETWDMKGGTEWEAEALAAKAARYREYFGKDGGVTLTGGEPLLQADFASEFFEICRQMGMGTCLDTSGSIWNESIEKLLFHTDRVLLDIKYTTDEKYREYVGCPMEKPMNFLRELEKRKIPTTIRQVVIPTLNDGAESIFQLREIIRSHTCVDKVELLPFKKICEVKYENMGKAFPLSHIPCPTKADVDKIYEMIV